jgi:hypothetical protein
MEGSQQTDLCIVHENASHFFIDSESEHAELLFLDFVYWLLFYKPEEITLWKLDLLMF